MKQSLDLDRRTFLAAGAAATAVAGGAMPVSAAINQSTTVDGKPVKTKIGLILYTLRDFLKTKDEIERTLARVKEIGYDAVEITSTDAIPNSELAKILKKNGLAAISCHCNWNQLDTEPQKEIDRWLEVGCHHLVVSSIPGNYRERRAKGYTDFAKHASEIGAKLKEQGVSLGYHNHDLEFEKFDGRIGQEILRSESDPNTFRFEIDTYWVQSGGADPAQWIEKVKTRVPTTHMKDMAIIDRKQIFAPVGDGNLNWKMILQACKAAGVEYYIVEQDVCIRDPFESIALSYKNMTSWGLS